MGFLACAHSEILTVIFSIGFHRCHPPAKQQRRPGKVSVSPERMYARKDSSEPLPVSVCLLLFLINRSLIRICFLGCFFFGDWLEKQTDAVCKSSKENKLMHPSGLHVSQPLFIKADKISKFTLFCIVAFKMIDHSSSI